MKSKRTQGSFRKFRGLPRSSLRGRKVRQLTETEIGEFFTAVTLARASIVPLSPVRLTLEAARAR